MMIDLKGTGYLFGRRPQSTIFVTQFINFVIVPFFAYGLGYLFFSVTDRLSGWACS